MDFVEFLEVLDPEGDNQSAVMELPDLSSQFFNISNKCALVESALLFNISYHKDLCAGPKASFVVRSVTPVDIKSSKDRGDMVSSLFEYIAEKGESEWCERNLAALKNKVREKICQNLLPNDSTDEQNLKDMLTSYVSVDVNSPRHMEEGNKIAIDLGVSEPNANSQQGHLNLGEDANRLTDFFRGTARDRPDIATDYSGAGSFFLHRSNSSDEELLREERAYAGEDPGRRSAMFSTVHEMRFKEGMHSALLTKCKSFFQHEAGSHIIGMSDQDEIEASILFGVIMRNICSILEEVVYSYTVAIKNKMIEGGSIMTDNMKLEYSDAIEKLFRIYLVWKSLELADENSKTHPPLIVSGEPEVYGVVNPNVPTTFYTYDVHTYIPTESRRGGPEIAGSLSAKVKCRRIME